MAIKQTTNAWGMPIWIDDTTGEQVADPSAASYTAPQQGNAYGQVAGKFLSGGYSDGQLQDNSAWNNPDGSVTWLSGGKPQVLSQADWDKEMARQVAADRGPLGALMELGTQFVLPAFGAYNLASGVGGLLDKAGWGAPSSVSAATSAANVATDSLGSGIKGNIFGNTAETAQGLKLGVPDLNYMGAGGTGIQGTIDGLGTLGKDGVITAANFANGGTQAIMPGSTVGNLTTNLVNDPMNLPVAGGGLLSGVSTDTLSKLAKSAMGLLGSGGQQQSAPSGVANGGGYSANIQPDYSLLNIQRPQYSNIFFPNGR